MAKTWYSYHTETPKDYFEEQYEIYMNPEEPSWRRYTAIQRMDTVFLYLANMPEETWAEDYVIDRSQKRLNQIRYAPTAHTICVTEERESTAFQHYFYIVEMYDRHGRLLWTKIGATKNFEKRMKQHYPIDYFPETGSDYPVRVFIYKDEVTAALDTTGDSLHKRGYRRMKVKAPIAENLAAGLIMLTPWQPGRVLVDPFCGSGTFLIEAALMSANIAPGLFRHFIAEDWTEIIPSTYWAEAREEARDMIDLSVETDLQGYDIDPAAIAAARENARLAGVEKLIHFQTRPISALSHPKKYGFIITNPPYGERLSPGSEALSEVELTDAARARVNTGALAELYETLGERLRAMDTWSLYVITSFDGCESTIDKKALRNRKIYNGMLKTYFYQFPGPRPPRRRSSAK